jgi:hypothetical protein
MQSVNYEVNETVIGRSKLRASSTALVIILVLVCVQSLSAIASGQSSGYATILGTISCSGQPVRSGGMVEAIMITALDPYTGQPVMGGPLTNAQASIDFSGHYKLQGLNPGIYDLYASANGFKPVLFASSITVLSGQSLHFDGSVCAVPEFFSPTVILIISVFVFAAISSVAKLRKRVPRPAQ